MNKLSGKAEFIKMHFKKNTLTEKCVYVSLINIFPSSANILRVYFEYWILLECGGLVWASKINTWEKMTAVKLHLF